MLTRKQFQTLSDQGPDAVFVLVTTLQEQIAALQAEVKTLRDRLDADSHNSNQPPSSDGLKKKPVSLRAPSGRKPGGQKGHPGKTLVLVQNPDSVVVHSPAQCACCGKPLADVAGQPTARRQVVDLPPLSLLTTEHQVQTKVCPDCRHATCAAFPVEVSQRVQ